MTRAEFIKHLANFLDTFPPGCSSYHTCDILFGHLERCGLVLAEFDEEDQDESVKD